MPPIPTDTVLCAVNDKEGVHFILEYEHKPIGFVSSYTTGRYGDATLVVDALLISHKSKRVEVSGVEILIDILKANAAYYKIGRIEFSIANGQWKAMQKLLGRKGAVQTGVVMELST